MLYFGVLITSIGATLKVCDDSPSTVETYFDKTEVMFNHGEHALLMDCASCHVQGDETHENQLSFTSCYVCHDLSKTDSTFITEEAEFADVCQRISEQNRED